MSNLARRVHTVLCLTALAAALAACERPSPGPTPSPTPQPGVEQITGSERIGWDQPAATAAELAAFRYLLYIDAASVELSGVSCAAVPGEAGFACSAQLPAISRGAHTLAVSAFTENGGRLESARSAALNVFVTSQSAVAGESGGSLLVTTTDGVRLQTRELTDGLDEPTDLAFAPDGRLYVAERAGRIRVVRGGQLANVPAVEIPDADTNGGGGLLAIAIDPQFASNRFVYAVYTFRSAFRLVRYRAAGDLLRERAILLDGIDASNTQPAASLRFGPDGRLYLAVDNAGDSRRGGDLGSYSGKVLRLNADATTPVDQAAGTPVFAIGLASPQGLAWDRIGNTLWVVEDERSGSDRLHAMARPAVLRGTQAGQAVAAVRYALPEGMGASAIAVYRGRAVPAFDGNLFVAAESARALLRIRLDAPGGRRIQGTEWMLRDVLGPVRAVAVSPEGEIVLCAGSRLVTLSSTRSARSGARSGAAQIRQQGAP